jgi:hypothetical protein
MDSVVRLRRQATPERWRKALQRARADGLRLYKVAGTGQAVVTSGRLHETVYSTDGIECECEAAMLGGDPVCKHRAIYWHDRGLLNDEASIFPELADLRVLDWGAPSYGRFADRSDRPIAA